MWLYCKSGFFSAVRHTDNENTIHVRARFKGDLERLCKVHGVTPKVATTPRNDYKCRIFSAIILAALIFRNAVDSAMLASRVTRSVAP